MFHTARPTPGELALWLVCSQDRVEGVCCQGTQLLLNPIPSHCIEIRYTTSAGVVHLSRIRLVHSRPNIDSSNSGCSLWNTSPRSMTPGSNSWTILTSTQLISVSTISQSITSTIFMVGQNAREMHFRRHGGPSRTGRRPRPVSYVCGTHRSQEKFCHHQRGDPGTYQCF